jgi:hypothetical protein
MSDSRGGSGEEDKPPQRHTESGVAESGGPRLFDGNKEDGSSEGVGHFLNGTQSDVDLVDRLKGLAPKLTGSHELGDNIREVLSNDSLGVLKQLQQIKKLVEVKSGHNPVRSYQLNKIIQSFNKYPLDNRGRVDSDGVLSEIDFDLRMQLKRNSGGVGRAPR